MPNKSNVKSDRVDLRQKLTADFVAALQADWGEHGKEIIEALRTRAPTKYAEILSPFMTPEPVPAPGGFGQCPTMEDPPTVLIAGRCYRHGHNPEHDRASHCGPRSLIDNCRELQAAAIECQCHGNCAMRNVAAPGIPNHVLQIELMPASISMN